MKSIVNRVFDLQEIKDYLNLVTVHKEADEVVTRIDGIESSRKIVTDRYEIFDFRPFVTEAVEYLSTTFGVKRYNLTLKGGVQSIKLFSDEVVVADEVFTKTFYIINSTDKSKALSISMGLSNKNMTINFVSKEGSVRKKHFNGINDFVEENLSLDTTFFGALIGSLESIIGATIRMSNVQRVITKSDVLMDAVASDRKDFENFRIAFSNYIRYNDTDYSADFMNGLNPFGRDKTGRVEDYLKSKVDPVVDCYDVFKVYLKIFQKRDVVEIIRQSQKIKNLTTFSVRSSALDLILEASE